MSTETTCPRCGATLAEGTAPESCPKCLMQVALEETEPSPSAGRRIPEPDELAGLFPHLEIGELLGRGGMGVVYRARQISLDRPVALKILAVDPEADPEFAERFAREAKALATLSHPNIVSIHDFGRAGEHYYLLMEFVDGTDLRQIIRDGEVQPAQALEIVSQICEALQYAHEEGVVHRDIKPENILLDRKGRAKIADFGLAKILGKDPSDLTLTGSRQVMGTVHYMAPEQMQDPLEVDHRADIYSLGVVLYELLTGEVPMGRFPPPSRKIQVDLRVDEIVLKALEREPEARYQRIGDVKTDLDRVQASPAPPGSATGATSSPTEDPAVVPAPAPPVPPAYTEPMRRPASNLWAWILGIFVVAIVGMVAAVWTLLLAPGTKGSHRGPDPAFVQAAAAGNLEGVEAMIEDGAWVDARDLTSTTALTAAASQGHVEIVRVLLQAGADVDVVGLRDTALAAAADSGHVDVVRTLLNAGATLDRLLPGNDTALIRAARNGNEEIVAMLLAAGADADAQGMFGSTALMHAAERGRVKIVQLLVAAGADRDLRNFAGSNALGLAAAADRNAIVEMLRARASPAD